VIREKFSGTEQERFGPTQAAEHLADEDGLEVGEETLRRWMLAEGCGAGYEDGRRTGSAGNDGRTLAIWYSSMAVSMRGLRTTLLWRFTYLRYRFTMSMSSSAASSCPEVGLPFGSRT
jgi:hypothetical protein